MVSSECIAELMCRKNGMFHGKPFPMHASFMGFVELIVYVVIDFTSRKSGKELYI